MKPDRFHAPDARTSGSPRTRRLALVGVAIAVAIGAGFNAVSLLRWSSATDPLRELALDERADEQERINAIVILQRNARATIRCMQELEQRGAKPIATHAFNVLDSIRVQGGWLVAPK